MESLKAKQAVKLHGRDRALRTTKPEDPVVPASQVVGESNTAMSAIGEITDVTPDGHLTVRIGEVTHVVKMTATIGRFAPEKLLSREVLLLRCGEGWVALDVMEPNDIVARELLQDTETPSFFDSIEATPDRLVLSALKHLELRVGKSSIVINDEGKITTRAERLLQWAKGAIRIKGGHVDIN